MDYLYKYNKYKRKYINMKGGVYQTSKDNNLFTAYNPETDIKKEGWISAVLEWTSDFKRDEVTVYHLINPKKSCFEIRIIGSKTYGNYIQINEGCLDIYDKSYQDLLNFIDQYSSINPKKGAIQIDNGLERNVFIKVNDGDDAAQFLLKCTTQFLRVHPFDDLVPKRYPIPKYDPDDYYTDIGKVIQDQIDLYNKNFD